MVKARFTVNKIERSTYNKYDSTMKTYEKVEMRTIKMTPVFSQSEDDPNKKFWDASPSGELNLGTINPAAWQYFELDKTYELTFEEVKS